ncbi:hypothetical protein QE152_g30381 [Popillia japonica]|uniref:Uncharacterized protein n=1 Tax=Popillia japonica TaxID=7064 RepID=A0AAW1JF88_POPJA
MLKTIISRHIIEFRSVHDRENGKNPTVEKESSTTKQFALKVSNYKEIKTKEVLPKLTQFANTTAKKICVEDLKLLKTPTAQSSPKESEV